MAASSESHTKKTVLLGITGCIAAYKSAEIVRALQKADVRVKVVMTEHACEFVGPTTFRALTHEPVATGLFDDPQDPIHHISLAQEADLFLIAPCTANVIAKLAYGIADDILTTTALATTAPILIAPAMNVHMYEAAPTRNNIGVLLGRGVKMIEAEEGYLACGDVGRGRLADVDYIVAKTLDALGIKRDLEGKKIVITAGPTEEAIDPVRCLTNRSSGKMGYALAKVAALRGAEVTLVSGPVALNAPEGVQVLSVRSAQEMLNATESAFDDADIALFTAAVCDMRPKQVADHKLKKGADDTALSNIELVKNPDILATLAGKKKESQLIIGFAAETDDVIENGLKKLESKGADLIVANQVGVDLCFGSDDNQVSLIENDEIIEIPKMSKEALAGIILDKAMEMLTECGES